MCDRNFCDYNSYYLDQTGGNLDISYYRGLPFQRGNGIFSNFAKRYGVPVLKYLMKHGKSIGREALSGMKTGVKRAASTALQDMTEKLTQKGSGPRRQLKAYKRTSKLRKRATPKKSIKPVKSVGNKLNKSRKNIFKLRKIN